MNNIWQSVRPSLPQQRTTSPLQAAAGGNTLTGQPTHTTLGNHTQSPQTTLVLPVLQCTAVDPIFQQVAAGDTSGRILLWPGVLQQVPGYSSAHPSHRPQVPGAPGDAQVLGHSAARPGLGSASATGGSTPQPALPVRTEHWHAEAVGALCFSVDGTLLLSGGREAVLVSFNPPSC